MKKMLHILGNLSPGGMGSFLMNLYRNIDRNKVQFDFIVMGENEKNFHEEAKSLGANIYKVTGLSKNPFKYFMEIEKIVKENKYDFVFRHTDVATVAIDLIAARVGGAKRRIPHSHSTSSRFMRLHHMLRPVLVSNATDFFACSDPAASWMFGEGKKYHLVKNGIKLSNYRYDSSRRELKRKELGIEEDTLVIGHVGNLVYAKNHLFMLDIFYDVLKTKPQSKLILAGEGSLRQSIEEKVAQLGIQDKVELLGTRSDIADLLQAMDVYLFPSVYEGLPIALVEAQAAGLPCIISDTIAPEIKLTNHIWAYPLQMSVKDWAQKVLEAAKMGRSDSTEELRKAGYDIMDTVRFYENL